jgi:hypothetical protein
MAQIHIPHAPHSEAWDMLSHIHISVVKMLLFYAVPLSVIPPAMIYHAGVMYGGNILPMLSDLQLLTIGGVFFVVELVMTFAVAYLIRRVSNDIDIKPAFEDCYKLAVVVPTPLWLAPVFLFIPSFILNIIAGAAALMLSGILIFYSVPLILKVESDNRAFSLAASILAVGMIAWVAMMILTLMTWSFVSSSLLLLV